MNTPRLFIIEGADSTGKTTLSRRIARHLGAVYIHATGSRPLYETMGAMTAYHQNIIDNARVNMLHGLRVVLDRHWPSEMCYGPVLRPLLHGREKYPHMKFRKALIELDVRYIFCFSDDACDRQLADKTTDHPYRKPMYNAVYRNYEALYKELKEVDRNTMIQRTSKYVLETDGPDTLGFIKKVIR